MQPLDRWRSGIRFSEVYHGTGADFDKFEMSYAEEDQGMKGFYDDILPRFMDKYGKKWGVTVEDISLYDLGDGPLTMHSVKVTPEMRESVKRWQVMFSKVANQPEIEPLEKDGKIIRFFGRTFDKNFRADSLFRHIAPVVRDVLDKSEFANSEKGEVCWNLSSRWICS